MPSWTQSLRRLMPLAAGIFWLCSPALRAQVLGPLVINPISDTNLAAGSSLTLTVSVTNTVGVSANSLNWTLPTAPAGASIVNSTPFNTAVLTWQPSSAQSPSTNNFTVQVQDLFNPTNITAASFHVDVFTNAVISPPFLAPISDVTVAEGELLTITNSAHTTDGTTNALVFSLASGAPAGATITPDTGIFSWTPTLDQAPKVWNIGVVVTQQGASSLSTTQSFSANVILTNNCDTYQDFVAAVTNGGYVPLTDCPTIILSNTLTITTDVTIDGSTENPLISGNNLVRLFTVLAPATLTLNGVTLSGGLSTNGGAIWVEAGAQALLSNCILAGNTAQGSDGADGANGQDSSGTGGNGGSGRAGIPGYGGAIFSAGDLTISACQFLTNRATGGNGGNGGGGGNGGYQGGNGGNGGAGGGALGGAVYVSGQVSIDSTTFDGNVAVGGNGGTGGTNGSGPFNGLPGIGGTAGAGSGAGLYIISNATVSASTFSQNSGTGGNSADGGTLSNGNGSNGPQGGNSQGGGMFIAGLSAVTNCTFFGNSVSGGNGGNGGDGNYNAGNGGNGGNGLGGAIYGSSGTMSVVNCTIAQNQARGGTNGFAGTGSFPGSNGSPGVGRGAGVARAGGSFYLQNTILFTNAPGTNANGTITDGGNNLSSDASLAGTSLKKKNPLIGPLADNGGPTLTMALLTTPTNSPAIDAGDDSAAPDVDQRGIGRPQGAHVDIGAFESTEAPGVSGQVLAGSNGLAGVTIQVGTNTVVTDANGRFGVSLTPGTYPVTPTLTNFGFDPSSVTITVPPGTNLSFSAFPVFSISGHVLDGTNGVAGVAVTAGTNSAVTDAAGAYTVMAPPGDYFVFASKTGYQFSPAQEITVGPSTSNVNFTVSQSLYTISGRVLAGGVGLAGVRIFGGQTTDPNGNFDLSVPAGTNVLTPVKPGSNYSFRPASRTVVVPPGATNQDFVAGWLISGLTRQADGTVSFLVVGSGSIRVEASSNLVNWVTLTNHSAPYQFIDRTAGSFPQRFYRAVSP